MTGIQILLTPFWMEKSRHENQDSRSQDRKKKEATGMKKIFFLPL
tara:strand:- start:299 stop:433 length:135 start_codon:yes stop_codon:yes gene_type:complete